MFLSFITYTPCCYVIMKGAKFEILPKCLYQSDGGLKCKLFLHINGSLEYTNYMIQISMEHFSGVSLVYRPSSV